MVIFPLVIVSVPFTVAFPHIVTPPDVLRTTFWYMPDGKFEAEELLKIANDPEFPLIVPPPQVINPEDETVNVFPLRFNAPEERVRLPLNVQLFVRVTPVVLFIVRLFIVAGKNVPVI